MVLSDIIMTKNLPHILPLPVERQLKKFGSDLRIARLKRGFTVATMAERLGIHRSTYSKMEKGDPMVGLGAYTQALFVLGFGTPFDNLIDQRSDEIGLLLNIEQLPKRVRPKKTPQGL